jgi:hypothetical protein
MKENYSSGATAMDISNVIFTVVVHVGQKHDFQNGKWLGNLSSCSICPTHCLWKSKVGITMGHTWSPANIDPNHLKINSINIYVLHIMVSDECFVMFRGWASLHCSPLTPEGTSSIYWTFFDLGAEEANSLLDDQMMRSTVSTSIPPTSPKIPPATFWVITTRCYLVRFRHSRFRHKISWMPGCPQIKKNEIHGLSHGEEHSQFAQFSGCPQIEKAEAQYRITCQKHRIQ